jgi:hypothetical protein
MLATREKLERAMRAIGHPEPGTSARWRAALAVAAGVLAVAGADAAPTTLDLADIVGGGDGLGSGGDAGVDVTDGSTTTTQTGSISAPTNVFVAAANPLIDGVVIPDGGPGAGAAVPISTTGLTVTGVSDATALGGAHTWDHVWNGTNFGTSTSWSGALLGMHANKGVTFDLAAIGAAHGGLVPSSFTAMPTTGSSAGAQVDFYAYVDGALVASASLAGSNQFAPGFSAPIPASARFLTLLVSSDGANTGDWSAFLNPTLDLVRPLVLGQVDDFDTSRDGWQRGQRVVEQGDGCLRIPGPEGVYTITFHTGEQWAGDYPAAGVERVRLALRNEGPATLNVRLAFGTTNAPSEAGQWVATATPLVVPPDGHWASYDVPIGPSDLVAVLGAGASHATVMPNVRTLRILHNPNPEPRGALADAPLCIDDVEALPEPARAAALGAGALLVAALAQRRRRR